MELVKNIFFNTDKIVENTEVKVTYAGTLFQNGSDSVNVHYGFGTNWNDAKDVPMEKTELGFQANIDITSGDTLNMCFNNSNGEWDNNYGSNYGFTVVKAENTEWTNGGVTTGTTTPSWNSTTTPAAGTPNWNNTTSTASTVGGYNYKTVTTGNAIPGSYGYNGTATTHGNSNVYGTFNTVTGTTNGNNNTTEPTGEVPIAVYKTPSWGDLFKKTFSNIKNYFSKVFGKGTESGNINNNLK